MKQSPVCRGVLGFSVVVAGEALTGTTTSACGVCSSAMEGVILISVCLLRDDCSQQRESLPNIYAHHPIPLLAPSVSSIAYSMACSAIREAYNDWIGLRRFRSY
ncbi:hypothetical protein BDW72DRAFT_188750 [Aspergillus terricola var. indicus]